MTRLFERGLRTGLRGSVTVLLAGAIVACGTSDKSGRQNISTSANAAAGGASSKPANGPTLPLAATTALQAGNAAYREKRYDDALARYGEATIAAPQHAAPWFGVFMVASAMQNQSLADSAMRRVKALSADPTALTAHAEVTATAPREMLPPPSSGTLPSGHPSTAPVPEGHPKYKLASPSKIDSVKRTRL